MAKLIILHGDGIDREVDLGERTVRIGRGDHNDIVLPDPAKSVSRSHAELRFEQGKYIIVDLNSQNGVWAAGRRVPQATLEPGTPVVLGSYRLVLKQELPAVQSATDATLIVSPGVADPASAATVVAPMPPSGPPPLPMAASAPGPQPRPESRLDPKPVATAIAPLPPMELPKPAAKPEPPPVAKPEPQKPTRKPEPPPTAAKPQAAARPSVQSKPRDRRVSRGLLFGAAAVLLLAALAAAVFLTPLGGGLMRLAGQKPAAPAAPVPPAEPRAAMPAAAAAPPAEQQPMPVAPPAAVPAPVEPPAPAPPPPKPAAAPAGKPAAMPPPVPKSPSETPPMPARTPPATAGARRGAVPAAAVELKTRSLNLPQMLEDARSAMNKGDYPAAIAGLEALLAADPKYPNAADLLGVARGGARNAAQQAVEAGNKSEMSGDYAGAARQYDRALQLDPESTAAPDAMRRLKARMQSEGEDAFKRARQYDALGRAREAIPMYEKAIQLLPPDHASAKTARERLAVLKGGE